MAKGAPSGQHSWESQGFHLSCLLILRMPAKCFLLWRGCICTLEKQKAQCLIQLCFHPLLCLTQPPRSPLLHQASCQALQKENGLLICTCVYMSVVQDTCRLTCPWDSTRAYTPHVTDCDRCDAFPTPGHSHPPSLCAPPSGSHCWCVCLLHQAERSFSVPSTDLALSRHSRSISFFKIYLFIGRNGSSLLHADFL